ncbi:hypothetical protein TNCV_3838281 [Trichonephila clavipes]|nr:hypothetical protein TNCV_3838281 [Trichonephila clavipes]
MPSKIPTVTKSSISTEAQLLPSTSSAAATSLESQPPVFFLLLLLPLHLIVYAHLQKQCLQPYQMKRIPLLLKQPHPHAIAYLLLSHPLYPKLLNKNLGEKSEILKLYVTLQHPQLNQK